MNILDEYSCEYHLVFKLDNTNKYVMGKYIKGTVHDKIKISQ